MPPVAQAKCLVHHISSLVPPGPARPVVYVAIHFQVAKVLKELHDLVTATHLGVQKLNAEVEDRFYWLGWF